jgi:hypothetical protein
MIFVISLLIFCYVIHSMCDERGVSPWAYLATFIAGYFLVFFGTSVAVIITYGPNIIHDPDMEKKVMNFVPFIFVFHFLLFYLFWRRLSRIKPYSDEDDDNQLPPPPPPGNKKDLSYFR